MKHVFMPLPYLLPPCYASALHLCCCRYLFDTAFAAAATRDAATLISLRHFRCHFIFATPIFRHIIVSIEGGEARRVDISFDFHRHRHARCRRLPPRLPSHDANAYAPRDAVTPDMRQFDPVTPSLLMIFRRLFAAADY